MEKFFTKLSFGLVAILLSTHAFAANITWLGGTSSDFNTASNWSTGSVPGPADRAIINNPLSPNACILSSNVTLDDLYVFGGASLDFNGFSATVTDDIDLVGAVLIDANIIGSDYTDIDGCTFNGTTFLSKNSAGFDDIDGGNTFNGPTTLTHNDNSRWRWGNTSGDTFNSSLTINSLNTGLFQIAHTGSTEFNGNVTINSSGSGDVRFGQSGGTSTVASGFAILSSGFVNGALEIDNLTQLGTAANGTFSPSAFGAVNSNFGGNITITGVSGLINLNNSNFTASNVFSGARIDVSNGCNFSTSSGSTSFTKTGANNDLWAGGNVFGNVIITNSGSGLLRLTDNSFDTFNGDLTAIRTGSGVLQIGHDGVNPVAGNISTVGSTSSVRFASATGQILMNSSGAQSISGSGSAIAQIDELVINKPSGDVTLNTPVIIEDLLDLTNGNIISSASNILILSDGLIVANVSDNSYVDGPVRKVGNDDFVFPTGKAGYYAPIEMDLNGTASATATHFTAEYFNSDPSLVYTSGSPLGTGVHNVSGCEYWELNRTASTASARVILHWNNSRCGTVVVTPDLLVSRWNGSQWVDEGNASITGTAAAGTISTPDPLTSFSPFALASNNDSNPLPVELISFDATVIAVDQVQIDWATASERSNDFFTIEKSKDGINWVVVEIVQGQGNTTDRTDYQLIDNQPFAGVSYYRLKQTDTNGAFEIFAPKSVVIVVEDQVVVYPNPASEKLVVRSNDLSFDGLQIVNALGQRMELAFEEMNIEGGEVVLNLNGFEAGVYFVLINNKSVRFVVK